MSNMAARQLRSLQEFDEYPRDDIQLQQSAAELHRLLQGKRWDLNVAAAGPLQALALIYQLPADYLLRECTSADGARANTVRGYWPIDWNLFACGPFIHASEREVDRLC